MLLLQRGAYYFITNIIIGVANFIIHALLFLIHIKYYVYTQARKYTLK